jgi:phosphatidylserine decarboxylase
VVVSSVIGGLVAVAIAVPLAWKWELGVARVAAAVAALAIPSAAVVALLSDAVSLGQELSGVLVCAVTLAAAFGVLAYRFYRDPERRAPERGDIVVSPADGEVIYVRKSVGGRFPQSTKKGRTYELVELTKTPLRDRDAVVVGIAMSFLDVHVNRAPVAGEIRIRKHFPGRFGSLGQPEMVYENERATTVIERPGLQVAVVQIASRLVRQIAGFVDVGDRVTAGQRIGVIRLGSQVDVVLPRRDGVRVTVEPGQRVRAGESILAELETGQPSAEVGG